MGEISLTRLRKELFRLMDEIAHGGEPVIVERDGVRIRIARDEAQKISKLARMRSFKGESVLLCPIEDIENHEWGAEVWKPHL